MQSIGGSFIYLLNLECFGTWRCPNAARNGSDAPEGGGHWS
jgi:hypothetical protein